MTRKRRKKPVKPAKDHSQAIRPIAAKSLGMQLTVSDADVCRVQVDGFDGPIDLLLSLVRERRLDIMTVPLASVAEQYIAYVAAMQAIDIEAAADYLVIAATLAYLKSRSLLPPLPTELAEEGEESPAAVEERLRARLIAYSRFRDIAAALGEAAAEATGFYLRTGGDSESKLTQRYDIAGEKLTQALGRVLAVSRPESRTIVRERFSVVLQMESLLRRVRVEGALNFADVVRNYDRSGIIVTFLAILELIRQGRLAVSQESLAVLWLRPCEVEPAHGT